MFLKEYMDGKYTVREYQDKSKCWMLDGLIHRDPGDGHSVEASNGTKKWHRHSLLHRDGAPAIECACGDRYWYIHGMLHREDGPAIERIKQNKEGKKDEYALNGIIITQDEFNKKV